MSTFVTVEASLMPTLTYCTASNLSVFVCVRACVHVRTLVCDLYKEHRGQKGEREKYNFDLKEDVKPREIKGDPVCALQTERALKAHLPRPRASVCDKDGART